MVCLFPILFDSSVHPSVHFDGLLDDFIFILKITDIQVHNSYVFVAFFGPWVHPNDRGLIHQSGVLPQFFAKNPTIRGQIQKTFHISSDPAVVLLYHQILWHNFMDSSTKAGLYPCDVVS